MEYISRRLLKVFAVALGEEAAFFDQFFQGDNSNFLRLNHYPVASHPETTMGVYHHTDAGALTVLLQDDRVASLQVFHQKSQTWTLVSPRKGTFTINIGDMLQIWSNDKFVAPLHRVLANGSAERFSAPFFYNPSYRAKVQPIIVEEGEEANYRPSNWREFRLARFQGDYADSGKEIQISAFKIHGPIDAMNIGIGC
ncbi:2og-fe oxygenase superfamily protein [Plasmopara halstedii]|uniref:2og-fe oxygenase superfamily protein n=1 Tax=Plasmopara halstedii TaxID=4781 RepID=A0A0P1B5W6_PLAHL|nr:2og-fe oxygenase superfamily protein [Plasmopara halstedii]CEG49085.1 2og-fe oxygenase superfamily protein [Plasmopara halstedii]|eukprot:XP_024585454.1 2og-fe oxygenase superfamily protein [Plasmopara halstedii]